MSNQAKEILSAREAAEFCDCSIQYLSKCRKDGTLKAHGRRNGTGTWMYKREALNRWLAGDVSTDTQETEVGGDA